MSLKRCRALPVVAIVALVASGVIMFIWSQQRRLIYFPSAGPVPSASSVLPAGRDVVVETQDGMRLGGWYFPHTSGGSGPAVLVCNGNAGDRSMRAELAVALHGLGLSVLLFDYRGYGGNPGRPSEQGLAADARAAQEWLSGQSDVDPARIAYFGESLGAAVAVGLAVQRPPAALVLRSPFTSLAEVGAVHYPWLPLRRGCCWTTTRRSSASPLYTRRCWSSRAAATTSSPLRLVSGWSQRPPSLSDTWWFPVWVTTTRNYSMGG